jgi:hypothetical protein
MRVALILPGLTRSAKICYDSLNKYLLSHYDIDIYIHTWDVSNVSLDASVSEREIEIDELEELYKPKKLVVEKYFDKRPFLIDKYKNYPKLEGTWERSMSMFYKVEQCFNLIEDANEYDCIIRCRMDLLLNEQLDLEKIDLSVINIPSEQPRQTICVDEYAYSIPHDSYGIIDVFSIGNYESMKKYCNVYSNLDRLCLEMGFNYHPELILKQNLDTQGTNIKRFDLDYSLVRKPNK